MACALCQTSFGYVHKRHRNCYFCARDVCGPCSRCRLRAEDESGQCFLLGRRKRRACVECTLQRLGQVREDAPACGEEPPYKSLRHSLDSESGQHGDASVLAVSESHVDEIQGQSSASSNQQFKSVTASASSVPSISVIERELEAERRCREAAERELELFKGRGTGNREQLDAIADLRATMEILLSKQSPKASSVATPRAGLSLSAAKEELEAVRCCREMAERELQSLVARSSASNMEHIGAVSELTSAVGKLSKQVESTDRQLSERSISFSLPPVPSNDLEARLAAAEKQVSEAQHQLASAECHRRDQHNIIQDLKGSIRVYCRVRPVQSGNEISIRTRSQDNMVVLEHDASERQFTFDKVFGPHVAQAHVFEEVSELVQSALDGYKVCVFAYGQTGSGKTFTMQGPGPSSEGIIPRSLRKIFETAEQLKSVGWEWSLKASFLEVYNEVIRDLLREPSPKGANSSFSATSNTSHVIKHDDERGLVVTNMTCVEVDSSDQIVSLMEKAARQRAVGGTDMNAESSRSHSVFTLYITGTNREFGTELHGALNLVDLAGSERLDKSGSTGDRLTETQHINKSLSTLVRVFACKAKQEDHVPFRDSKLTHLLEPCLSGQGKTLMMVNVGPEVNNSHETLCSLRFASQVNQCDTGGKARRTIKTSSEIAKPVVRRSSGSSKPPRWSATAAQSSQALAASVSQRPLSR